MMAACRGPGGTDGRVQLAASPTRVAKAQGRMTLQGHMTPRASAAEPVLRWLEHGAAE